VFCLILSILSCSTRCREVVLPARVPIVKILITNDDGWESPGIHVLQEVASEFGEAIVVAPDRDQSGVGQAITLMRPLRLRSSGGNRFAVEGGTPTDCVYVGIHHVLDGEKPDLVLSGINAGPNLGWDVHYSGTVAGVREAALQGIAGVAFSLLRGPGGFPFESTRRWVRRVLEHNRTFEGRPFTFYNVNIPHPDIGPVHGIRVTKLGQRYYAKDICIRSDPRGGEYFWIGGDGVHMPDIPGSDCNAVRDGYVSVTPLCCDVTCPVTGTEMAGWNEDGYE